MFVYTLLTAVEEGPAPQDVKAGWVALIIFLLLAVAVAVLGWSLTRHLRKTQAAKDAGVYGDVPRTDVPRTDEPRSDEPRSDEPRSDGPRA